MSSGPLYTLSFLNRVCLDPELTNLSAASFETLQELCNMMDLHGVAFLKMYRDYK